VDIYIGIVTVSLILIALTAILNAITFPRLSILSKPSQFPLVSVLIPARDEGDIIRETVKCWLSVIYPNHEVLILDDQSSDDTASIALTVASGDPRVRILQGAPLPDGWKGKNWACHQFVQAARGDILIFTDADVRWEPQALTALVAEMIVSRADLFTVWPTQITETLAERLVVPLMGFVIIGYLPLLAVHHINWPIFSAAVGQCLAFRRQAYEAIGGHEAISKAIVEDMAFARGIKRRHLHLRAADGAGIISTRMYHGWPDVRDGFAKNILGGHGNSMAFLAFSTFFHWSLFVFPWVWLFFDPIQAMILGSLGILVRALTAAVTRQRLRDALFLPVSVLLMTLITVRSAQWHFTGGPRWRGRIYGS
jgi:chlorobactene glucosyltransferase